MSKHSDYRPHPWHGLSVGPEAPDRVHAYIEMTPSDRVKYEIDKETGYLIIDRPQKYSSQLPMLYGFIPRTYCGEQISALSPNAEHGDGDPLDICVLADAHIDRAGILVRARVIGGIQMIDGGEADDKIVSVLIGDSTFGHITDLSELPRPLVDKLCHYFLTYKMAPGMTSPPVNVDVVYGREHAHQVVLASMADYEALIQATR